MMLFIGNLPARVTEADLSGALRLSSEERRRIRIVRKPGRHGETLRYGLLQPRTDAEARKLMNKSRAVVVNGQNLALREFVKRVANNERRAMDWRDKPWPYPERRKQDRRNQVH